MGLMDQPTAFFGGGRIIKGDIELTGDLLQDPIRIGLNAQTLPDTMAIGINADATGTKSIAIGRDSIANNQNNTALGREAEATGGDATALGNETTAPSRWNTVIGYGAGADEDTVGLEPNGENVVLVGRKSQASGNNAVAIGEISRANGDNSTAIGRGTQAFADNSSVFGQGSVAGGTGTTVVGQGVTVNTNDSTSVGKGVNITGSSATAVGVGAEASADNATAIGDGASAQESSSVAIGQGSTVSFPSAISFGDRDISLQNSRSILYPVNSGSQTLVDLPVDDTISAGVRQEFTFDIGGEPIFVVRAESDGSGGIQNAVGEIKGSFGLDGDTNQVDDVITGDISIQDSSGTEQIGLDATVTPVKIDLHNNRLLNFGIRSGEDITYPDDTGAERLVNFNVTSVPTAGTEMSYSFAVDDTDIAKVFAEANGSGGIQNPLFIFLEDLDVNSNDIIDGGTTIWDAANNYIPQERLENDSLTLSAGNGLTSGGLVSLGGSTSIGVATNGIQLDEIDESIAPDWSGNHIFGGGVEIGTLETTEDPGASVLVDAPITSTPSQGSQQSYSFQVGGVNAMRVYGEADGSGGVQNVSVAMDELRVDTVNTKISSSIDFSIRGTRRGNLDSSGNLDIEGQLTEGAAL